MKCFRYPYWKVKCYRCSAILGRKLLKKTKIKKWCQVCFHIAVSLATSVFLYFFRCISVFLSMYSAILKSGGAAAAFALSLPPFWQHLYFFLYFCISSFVFLYFFFCIQQYWKVVVLPSLLSHCRLLGNIWRLQAELFICSVLTTQQLHIKH